MKKPAPFLRLILLGIGLLSAVCACEGGSNNTQTKETVWEESGSTSTGGGADTSGFTGPEAEFLLDAYSWGLMIVQYSQLAAEKAENPSVKSFAEQSASWYRKLNQEIEQQAAQGDVELPKVAGDDVQTFMDQLSELSAPEFEQRYLQVLRVVQRRMIARYQSAAGDLKDSKLQSIAAEKIPDLQAHAQSVEELLKQLQKR